MWPNSCQPCEKVIPARFFKVWCRVDYIFDFYPKEKEKEYFSSSKCGRVFSFHRGVLHMLDEQLTAYGSGRKNEMEYFNHIFC